MLDRLIRLAVLVRVHTFFKFFDRFLRELPVIFLGVDQVWITSFHPLWQGIFLAGRARRQRELHEINWRGGRVYFGGLADGLVGIIVDHNPVLVRDKAVEAEAALVIAVSAPDRRAAHFQRNQYRVGGEVAPYDSNVADDLAELVLLCTKLRGSNQSCQKSGAPQNAETCTHGYTRQNSSRKGKGLVPDFQEQALEAKQPAARS